MLFVTKQNKNLLFLFNLVLYNYFQKSNNYESDQHCLNEILLIDAKMDFLRRPPINLCPTDFKLLADSLLTGSEDQELRLKNVFDCNDNDSAFSNHALAHSSLMVLWQNFQLAQSCVNNKLKTGLGKAQETLTAFEKVLRQNAAALLQNKQVNVTDCRRLLGFFDLLEKSFVNAWDGCSLNWYVKSNTS